jgi:gas vesicle protein
MPQARVQLAIEVETEGVEQLTTLRRQLEQLGQSGSAAVEQLDASVVSVVERLQESRALVATTTREFLRSQRQLFASLEPVFQGFFNRLLTGSRNFRDALKQLFNDLLRYFLRTVEQMAAGWLAGFRRMGAGSALPGLFGGGFGSGTGGVLGLLAPLVSSGLGFQLGPGGTAPTFPTAGGGGFSATGLNIFSQLGIPLQDLSLAGVTIPGGLLASGGLLGVLAGYQSGSRVLGTLGGAAAGFAFGGPIGAVIGAVAGFFAGLLGRGKKKRQATKIAQEGFAEMRKILEQFKRFEVNFDSALAAINSLWQQMQAGWQQLGKSIFNRSVSSQKVHYDTIVSELNQIQQARETRARLIEALPIPEVQLGGLVRAVNAHDGKILAYLHEGEAVLNRRAVQQLGEQGVRQLNAASPPRMAAAGSVSIQISIDGRGSDPEQVAALTLRKLKRELQDRGLRLG